MKQSVACPLPQNTRLSWTDVLRSLASFGSAFWLRALGITLVAGLLIGLPTQLIPNPIFMRMIPATWVDYVIFIVSAMIIGITWAVPGKAVSTKSTDNRSIIAGLGTLFAVGCPTCNKLILLLLGSGGALSYFAPLQPILGVAAILLLLAALRRKLGQVPVVT